MSSRKAPTLRNPDEHVENAVFDSDKDLVEADNEMPNLLWNFHRNSVAMKDRTEITSAPEQVKKSTTTIENSSETAIDESTIFEKIQNRIRTLQSVKQRLDDIGNPEKIADIDLLALAEFCRDDEERIFGIAQMSDPEGRAWRSLFTSGINTALANQLSLRLSSKKIEKKQK